MTVASAPGKVVLCGEYAVLDGAPAICMAIERRAVASVSWSRGETNRVSAPGYAETDGVFRAGAEGPEWLQGRDKFELVDAVWRAANVSRDEVCMIHLDTRGFIDEQTDTKFGVGSSAALTVALTLALTATDDLSGVASRAHAAMQGGMGSGVDIACSIRGGLIEYRLQGARVKSLQWPETLAYRLLWTGIRASTVAQLVTLQTAATEPSRARLVTAAETSAAAWRSGVADNIIGGYYDYVEKLRAFSTDHDLGVFDAGHGQLADAAARVGLVYKPCGAGGGDVGILLGTDEAKLDAFVSGENAAAFSLLECDIDHSGARNEEPGKKQR